MNDPRSWTEILIGVPVLGAFVGVVVQQRNQVNTLQSSLDKANEALDQERDSCGERLSLIEQRLDKERDDCDARHRRLESDIDELRRVMRKMTPRDFPAVKE